MIRSPSIFALVVFCGAVACGPASSGPSDAGEDKTTSAEYWGLVDKRCLHYADSKNRETYTLEIAFDKVTVTGIDTWRLTHREQGWEQRIDWLERVDNKLVLRRRKISGQSGDFSETLNRYTPPPVFLRDNLQEGDNVESVASTRVDVDGAKVEEAQEQTFRTASLGEESIKGPDGEVMAQKLTLSRETPTDNEVERAWFVPELGFVKIDPPGPVGDQTLVRVELLSDGANCSPP